MTLSEDLNWRGLVKDKTFTDLSWLDQPKTFYLGIDASDDSLTIGNLAVILLTRRLTEAGWKTVILAGGATSMVGDPGGKLSERELQSKEEISKNIEAIKAQIEKLLAGSPHELVNNIDWLGDEKLLDFLRDVGKSFSMTELMQREFVNARMGHEGGGISYAEFSYSLLQGYDFLWLFKNKGVELQIGASDQWGNMLSGVALIRKKEGKEAHAFSMPLVVNKETGQKFGKSEAGAIWLDPQKTTPTQFYQFWINTDDADVENYLKVFTLFPKEQIEQVMSEHSVDPSARRAQKTLAGEVTKIVHGQDSSGSASSVTKYLTGQVSLADANESEIAQIKREIPSIKIATGASLINALTESGLAGSNTEASRLVSSGAIYINNEKAIHGSSVAFKKGYNLLRRGKAYKDSALIELE